MTFFDRKEITWCPVNVKTLKNGDVFVLPKNHWILYVEEMEIDSPSTLNKYFMKTVYSYQKTEISKKCFTFFYCETKISKKNLFFTIGSI